MKNHLDALVEVGLVQKKDVQGGVEYSITEAGVAMLQSGEVFIRREDGGLAYLDVEKPIEGDGLEGWVFERPQTSDLDELELPLNIAAVLQEAGIHWIEELTKKTWRDLLHTKGIGNSKLNCIINALERKHLNLMPEEQ